MELTAHGNGVPCQLPLGGRMQKTQSALTPDTFAFFQALAKNNKTAWMNQNRQRYQEAVVQPFRRLLEDLTPQVLDLNSEFEVSGRSGANFSRINRDIRFAKDKTPYRPQMYLKFSAPSPEDRESGQLYIGASAKTVTVGFRVYAGPKRKQSCFALLGEPRLQQDSKWVTTQKKRLGRKYDSYWYVSKKGQWTKTDGWPVQLTDWKTIQGWVVRKELRPADGLKPGFVKESMRIFRDLYPLLQFTSLPE